MAQNEEKKGVLPQIIVAVVVALLVGSTAPWWWYEIFPGKNVTPTPIPSTGPVAPTPQLPPGPAPDEPVQGGRIQVQCTTNPHSVPAGGQVEIRVLAFTEKNSPVRGAHVRIESGGGWFAVSGTTTEVGQTDSNGVFGTQWRSPMPAAKGYGMTVTVSREGFAEGKSECNVPIQ